MHSAYFREKILIKCPIIDFLKGKCDELRVIFSFFVATVTNRCWISGKRDSATFLISRVWCSQKHVIWETNRAMTGGEIQSHVETKARTGEENLVWGGKQANSKRRQSSIKGRIVQWCCSSSRKQFPFSKFPSKSTSTANWPNTYVLCYCNSTCAADSDRTNTFASRLALK
jgi:hypothetical protein